MKLASEKRDAVAPRDASWSIVLDSDPSQNILGCSNMVHTRSHRWLELTLRFEFPLSKRTLAWTTEVSFSRRGASNVTSSMSSSFLPPSIKMSSLAGGSSTRCYQRKNSLNVVGAGTTALALPSPTGSSSETSDYQRSTPSPRDEQDSGIGEYPFDFWRWSNQIDIIVRLFRL